MQREPIYLALQNQLTALMVDPYNVLVVSRGWIHFDEADQQPAIYIVPKNERAEYKRGLPTKWVMELDLYVYSKWSDSVNQGVSNLAILMDAIEYILSPVGPNSSQTTTGRESNSVNSLNGLVVYCALQGVAEISGGFLNRGQTIARMPLEIMVA